VSASVNPAAEKVDEKMVSDVRALFLRFPPGTRLTSKQIARTLGIHDGEAQPLTRAVIAQVVREGLPVGGDARGYRVLETEADLQTSLADLEHRERAIGARKIALERAFREHYEKGPDGGDTLERWTR
jgi:hypothetical protein